MITYLTLGYTAAIMFVGILIGISIENKYLTRTREDWLNGKSIEDQMANDGWKI
jgi:hypothetical protein